MNAKKCKKLRKIARENSPGAPARSLTQRLNSGRRFQLVNAPNTTRGVYSALKKGYLEITTTPPAG